MDYDWITPRIALGSAIESRHDARELVAQGITHVVNMSVHHDDTAVFRGFEVVLADFGLLDGENDPGVGAACIGGAIRSVQDALEAAPHHKVYLHCAAGISRSAAVMVGYLMRTEGLSLADATRRVRDARPCINPHPAHFMALLEVFAPSAAQQRTTPTWGHGPQA